MATTVKITNNSRYKDTLLYAGSDGPEFGLYAAPSEFLAPASDDVLHIVQANEVGFLDRLAERYYGAGNETLWWAIAQLNAIVDAELEMFAGMTLRIPVRTRVFAFTSRAGLGA